MFRKIFKIILFGSIILFQNVLAAELININTADVVALDTLPGIGAVKAQAIVDYRTQNGPFQKIEDIINVSGIGQVTFDNMKSMITVGTVETAPAPVVNLPPQTFQVNNTEIIQTQEEILGFEIGSVVINELVSDPTDGEVEFVELYNTSIYSIDLNGWWIEEGSGKKSLLSYNIPANGFYVLEKPKGSLNNAGEIVKLFDPVGGLIDQVVYGDWDDGNKNNNAPKAEDPYSLARKDDGEDFNNDTEDFVLTKIITKGEKNFIENETKEKMSPQKIDVDINLSTTTGKIIKTVPIESTSTTINEYVWLIKISEFIPNPQGLDSAEFIELYNFGNAEINLSGLKVDDGEGGSRPYIFPENTKIEAQSYLTVAGWETKISLNNTENMVRLMDAKNNIIDEVFYKDVVEGASYSQDDKGVWFWSASVTPGKKNIIKSVLADTTPVASKLKTLIEADLKNFRNGNIGSRIKVSGAVAVLPGVFGAQYFYIVNENAGVQIYMYKKDFPDLSVGEMISVSGEISEAYGEKRVKTARKEDIVKLGENRMIEPYLIEIAEIDESLIGGLVRVNGEITEIKSSYMYLDDGTGEIKIYFKSGANIDKKNFKVGDMLQANGILIERTGGYQIQPRFTEDIRKNEQIHMIAQTEDVKNQQKEVAEKYLATTAVGLSSILVGIFIKARGNIFLKIVKRAGTIALSFVKRK